MASANGCLPMVQALLEAGAVSCDSAGSRCYTQARVLTVGLCRT